MRKITAGMFITLDGVIEAPQKWNPPYYDDEMNQAVMPQLANAGTHLYGRRSYELFRAVFTGPSAPPHAQMMTSTPKVVVSTTLDDPAWGPTTVISSDVAAELTKLKQQPGGTSPSAPAAPWSGTCSPKACSTNSSCWCTRSWSAPVSTCSRAAATRFRSTLSKPGRTATASSRSATPRPVS